MCDAWRLASRNFCSGRIFVLAAVAVQLTILSAAGEDWPTYRHDNARSRLTAERIAPPLELRWVYHARHAPQPAWPPPAGQDFWHRKTNLPPLCTYDRAYHVVSAAGRVYFGTSADDQVVCLDAATGRRLWNFFAEGPVRLAPAIDASRVYFGSDDGCAYCLDAADGHLIWKHDAAAGTRRWIPGNGRMISAAAVRSGVMIHEGKAHFTAGLFPKQGVFQITLDAETGKQLARQPLGISPQGYMELRGDTLLVKTGRMPPKAFSKVQRRGQPQRPSPGKPPQQYPHALIGAAEIRFAGGDGGVAALNAENREVLWTAPVDGRAYSLAAGGGCLFVGTDRGAVYCFGPAGGERSAPAIKPPSEPFAYPNDELRRLYCKTAEAIIEQSGFTKGYCLVLDAEYGRLVYELAKRTELNVIGLEDDAEKVAAARRALDQAGLYGRAVIHHGPLDRLRCGDWLMNLIVADGRLVSGPPAADAAEVLRVLRPEGGTACLGRAETSSGGGKLDPDALKKWLGTAGESAPWQIARDNGPWLVLRTGSPGGAGQWTHAYADPANTTCSGERRIGDSLRLQWFGRPGPQKMIDRHHRPFPPLYNNGRLFVSGNNHLFGLDAYNGTILWQREMPDTRRISAFSNCAHTALADDVLYVASLDRCLGLDVATGEQVSAFATAGDPQGKPQHWGYVATVGDRLFGSATAAGASRTGHSRTALSGCYWDFVPLVTSRSLFCLDRRSGRRQWRYHARQGAIINTTITIGGGRMYFVQSDNPQTLEAPDGRAKLAELLGNGAHLIALEAAGGKILWNKPIDLRALQNRLHGCYADEKLVLAGSRNQERKVWYDLHAFDARSGDALWRQSMTTGRGINGDHGEQDQHPVVVGRTVYLEPYAWDLATGKPVDGWRLKREGHGCGQVSASASAFYFRAGNPTTCNLATGQKTKITTVSRPGCWINMIPAGGLLLIPEASSGCTCPYPVQSSMAFVPAP